MNTEMEEDDVFPDYLDSLKDNFAHLEGIEIPSLRKKLSRLSVSVPTKGLVNAPGENNCYLNASVQLLWHMNVFRRSFRLLDGHACVENACIFCALKRIFQQFQDSDARVLAADDLRQAMANAFQDEHRFQLGRMDDAAECFENILHRLHSHIANAEYEDTCSAKHCIPHQKFGQHILEQTSCKCQATSEPKSFYQFVHYVSASALVTIFHDNSLEDYEYTFGEYLKLLMQSGERRACPDERRCLYKGKQPMTTVQMTLMNSPDVFTVGVIWDTDRPSSKYLSSFMDCIGENLYLIDLFDNIPDDTYRRIDLKLSGVVAYYGKHYTSFFYNSLDNLWYYFDDEHVQEVGPNWKNVKQKFYRCKFQPLLLTYTNAIGEPVDVSNAPNTVDLVSKEKLLYQPPQHPVVQKRRGHSQRRHKKGKRNHLHPHENLHIMRSNSDETASYRGKTSSHSQALPVSNLTLGQSIDDNVGPQQRFVDEPYLNNINKDATSLGGHYMNGDGQRKCSSENSIVEMKDIDHNELNISSRAGDYLRKKINLIKKKRNSNDRNEKLSKETIDALESITPADIGFDAYPKRNLKTVAPNNNSLSSNEIGIQQSNNMERHHDVLKEIKRKLSQHKDELSLKVSNERRNVNTKDYFQEEVPSGCPPDKTNPNLNNLYMSSQVVDLESDDSSHYTQGGFESLVSKGEYFSIQCEHFEKERDLSQAIQTCMKAKNAYCEASKIPGINKSVIQFVDMKCSQCTSKAIELQKKFDSLSSKEKLSVQSDGNKVPAMPDSSGNIHLPDLIQFAKKSADTKPTDDEEETLESLHGSITTSINGNAAFDTTTDKSDLRLPPSYSDYLNASPRNQSFSLNHTNIPSDNGQIIDAKKRALSMKLEESKFTDDASQRPAISSNGSRTIFQPNQLHAKFYNSNVQSTGTKYESKAEEMLDRYLSRRNSSPFIKSQNSPNDTSPETIQTKVDKGSRIKSNESFGKSIASMSDEKSEPIDKSAPIYSKYSNYGEPVTSEIPLSSQKTDDKLVQKDTEFSPKKPKTMTKRRAKEKSNHNDIHNVNEKLSNETIANDTLQRLKEADSLPLRCRQCGWRVVEPNSYFCIHCQSEYI